MADIHAAAMRAVKTIDQNFHRLLLTGEGEGLSLDQRAAIITAEYEPMVEALRRCHEVLRSYKHGTTHEGDCLICEIQKSAGAALVRVSG